MSTSTQLAASTADSEPCTPWLPPELIHLILVELWEEPHPPQDRSALLVKIALVNRTWLALIVHITTLDVHLSSFKETMDFLRLLPQGPPTRPGEGCDLLTMERKRVANQFCRSLNCHVDGRMWQNLPTDAPLDISLVFLDLSLLPHLPNLRRILISHTDWTLNDVFRHLQQAFPKQVTHLSLDYSFTGDSTAKFPPFDPHRSLLWLHAPPGPAGRRGPILTLRHLSLSGVPASFAVVMLHACPNVETLELMHPGELFDLAPLPPATRALVLRDPGVALSKRKMRSWLLPMALDEGLFPTGANLKPPRIIIRSGTPDPVSFACLRLTCKRFNVDLVYEREDARSPLC